MQRSPTGRGKAVTPGAVVGLGRVVGSPWYAGAAVGSVIAVGSGHAVRGHASSGVWTGALGVQRGAGVGVGSEGPHAASAAAITANAMA